MLYIVRHGRTSANASRCLQGRLDLPLDDVGRAQAAALVGVVPSPSRVIVSPMLRAHQTASVFGVGPEVDERWHEMGYGELEGVPLDEVPPATWATWRSDPTFAPPGGESLQQVATAARSWLASTTSRGDHGSREPPGSGTVPAPPGGDGSLQRPWRWWQSVDNSTTRAGVALREGLPCCTEFRVVHESHRW
ncbi:MAG: histidine phosphatase family protein [Ilumatobacteraceae bacterium]